VASGSYTVKNANAWGRIGEQVGKGLAESIPREVERSRLSSGLNQFSNESANLNPVQQLAQLSAIPGVTPQMLQTFGELARQQSRANAFQGQPGGQQGGFQGEQRGGQPQSMGQQQQQQQQMPVSPFPQFQSAPSQPSPSITREEPLARAQQGYIPPAQQERYQEAERRFTQRPAFYNNDPAQAISEVDREVAIEDQRQQAFERLETKLTGLQEKAVGALRGRQAALSAQGVPENVYSKIEDQFIQDTKAKSEGGRGSPIEQAAKKYGQQLDDIARDYGSVGTIGSWGLTDTSAKKAQQTIKSLQKRFAERGDTENFADQLIAKSGLSPSTAYAMAQPVRDNKELNLAMSKIPFVQRTVQHAGRNPSRGSNEKIEDIQRKTLEISKILSKSLGKTGSPLAVAYELQKKGYDPQIWLDYLTEHADELDLPPSQQRQLAKPDSLTGTWGDWWLNSFTGVE